MSRLPSTTPPLLRVLQQAERDHRGQARAPRQAGIIPDGVGGYTVDGPITSAGFEVGKTGYRLRPDGTIDAARLNLADGSINGGALASASLPTLLHAETTPPGLLTVETDILTVAAVTPTGYTAAAITVTGRLHMPAAAGQSGYLLSRIKSGAAASTAVPAWCPAGAAVQNVSVLAAQVVGLTPGQPVTVTLTGWSPTSGWAGTPGHAVLSGSLTWLR